MSRLERSLKGYDFDTTAYNEGWRRNRVNNPARMVTYYRGASYLRIHFSRWIHDIDSIDWWDDEHNRLHRWEPKFKYEVPYVWIVRQILSGEDVDKTYS